MAFWKIDILHIKSRPLDGFSCKVTGVLMKWGNSATKRHRQRNVKRHGRQSCADEARDHGDGSTIWGAPKIPHKLLEGREEAQDRVSCLFYLSHLFQDEFLLFELPEHPYCIYGWPETCLCWAQTIKSLRLKGLFLISVFLVPSILSR